MHLTPSFRRCAWKVAIPLSAVIVAGYFSDGYFRHHWWSASYWGTVSMSFPIMISVVWFAFVPSHLEITESGISIRRTFGRLHSLPWEDLRYWGQGEGVFLLEFDGLSAFQIQRDAYPTEEWAYFIDLLSSRAPQRKTSRWIGPRGFRWREK